MHFIVLDLEATCWDGNPPTQLKELIELAAFRVNRFGETLDAFQRFVRPTHFPYLSPYCRKLTTINQSDIDQAQNAKVVLQQFQNWIGDDEYLLCAWGAMDQTILQLECEEHLINSDWIMPYIDVKKQYHQMQRASKINGLASTLRREGIDFEGTMHRADDDAFNLVKLFVRYIDQWVY